MLDYNLPTGWAYRYYSNLLPRAISRVGGRQFTVVRQVRIDGPVSHSLREHVAIHVRIARSFDDHESDASHE